jgi:hypothetical protein
LSGSIVEGCPWPDFIVQGSKSTIKLKVE